MAAPFAREDLEKLKNFVDFVSQNPLVLNMPQLSFVKKFVEQFGGKVPQGAFEMPAGGKCPFGGNVKAETKTSTPPEENIESPDMEVESEESEIELDMEGVIEPDTDVEQPMGDFSKTPTEEEVDKASELRSKAAGAYSEQQYQEAIDLYTQAIELNPGNALFHAKRGQAFLKLAKPNACIRDCNKALEINCDSAAAYKFRGRAHRLLGNWEKAAKDLRQACKLDFDEEADEWLREVTPNAKKIEQHRLKQQRKKAEHDRRAKPQKARQQQQQGQQKPKAATGEGSEGVDSSNMGDFLSCANDPEIMMALLDILNNSENIDKYKSNPKMAKLLDVFKNSYAPGMRGGFPGAMPGGFPGAFPPGFPTPPTTDATATGNGAAPQTEIPKPEHKKPDFVDDGLD